MSDDKTVLEHHLADGPGGVFDAFVPSQLPKTHTAVAVIRQSPSMANLISY
jgi:hypothetical protein